MFDIRKFNCPIGQCKFDTDCARVAKSLLIEVNTVLSAGGRADPKQLASILHEVTECKHAGVDIVTSGCPLQRLKEPRVSPGPSKSINYVNQIAHPPAPIRLTS